MSQTREYAVRVCWEDDAYWAEVEELPGCFVSGDTLDELRDAIGEAIALYLTDDPDGVRVTGFAPQGQSPRIREMRVAVPA